MRGFAIICAWVLALFGKGWSQDIMTKQAEIELAGQAAAKDRPPIQDNDDPTIDGRSNDKENQSRQDKKNQEIKGKYKDNTFSDFFYSLSRWIVTGEWKERQFIEELEKRYVNQTEELSSVDIFLKSSFWSLNSNIIKDALPIVTEKAYTGQLTFDELIKFLQTVFMLKSIDESLIKDIDYEKIEKGLDKRIQKIRSGEVNEPQRHTLAENHTIDSRAISINQKIEQKIGIHIHI